VSTLSVGEVLEILSGRSDTISARDGRRQDANS